MSSDTLLPHIDKVGRRDSLPNLTARQRFALALVVLLATALFNWGSIRARSFAPLFSQDDVHSILLGYARTPKVWVDGLRWWRGPWIQEGIHAYRPLASYLLWLECWFGYRTGFAWMGLPGAALLAVCSLLSAELGLRWTRSFTGACLTGVMAAGAHWPLLQEDWFLQWFPSHQDLLQCALLLGALLQFDAWYCRGGRWKLAAASALFGLAALTKEFAYIFPALALAVVLLRTGAPERRKVGAFVAVGFAAAIAGLYLYRSAVLTHPYNPTLKPVQVLDKSGVFMYQAVWLLLRTEPWAAGLGVLVALSTAVGLRLRAASVLRGPIGAALGTCAALVTLWIYLWLTTGSPIVSLESILIPEGATLRNNTLIVTLMTYQAWLFWKYRHSEPTAVAWLLLFLFYVPVLDFAGWHYTMPAWFVRAPYNVLTLCLIWRDARPGFLKLTHRKTGSQPQERRPAWGNISVDN